MGMSDLHPDEQVLEDVMELAEAGLKFEHEAALRSSCIEFSCVVDLTLLINGVLEGNGNATIAFGLVEQKYEADHHQYPSQSPEF